MFAKRGIWVKGCRALSFGPLTPDGTSRFLRLSRAHTLTLSLSLPIYFPPPHFTPNSACVVSACLPHSHSFFCQPKPFSLLTLMPQAHRSSPLLIIRSVSLWRFHSFSGVRSFQGRVNRKGNPSRHMTVDPPTHPPTLIIYLQWVLGRHTVSAGITSTNYHILEDFSCFLFLTPTSFPRPPFHFV